jgi:hypothetical protein
VSQAERAPPDLKTLYTGNANLFNGMIIEIEGEERMIMATKPTLDLEPPDWPDAVIREGKNFKIKSVFKSSDGNGLTQIDLACEDVTRKIGKCGGYTTSIGTYAPDDPFTRPQVERTDQGVVINLNCREGYRSVSEDCLYSGRMDVDSVEGLPPCFVTDNPGAQTRLKRKCSGCNYVMIDDERRKCKPLTCASNASNFGTSNSGLDDVSDDIEWTLSSASQISYFGQDNTIDSRVKFGFKQVVKCKRGFLAGQKASTARGLPAGGFPGQYTRQCGQLDDDYENDHVFHMQEPGPCKRTLCGVFKPPADSSVDVDNTTLVEVDSVAEEWRADLQIVHGENIVVKCNAGYRRSDAQSSFASPCGDVIIATCDAGKFIYDGSLGNSPPPTCVPLRCGTPADDVCGTETCDPSTSLGEGVDMDETISSGPLRQGEFQNVTCVEGYRRHATASKMLGPVCEAEATYNRTCGWCTFDDTIKCEKIVCNSSGLVVDPNGISDSLISRFGDNGKVTCNYGYRAQSSADPEPVSRDSPKQYDLHCNSSCSLDGQGMQCQKVKCPLPGIANAVKPTISLYFNDVGVYTCKPGYKRKGTKSTLKGPCDNKIPVLCDDGILVFTAGESECEKITGCAADQVCGSEKCTPHTIKDANAVVPAAGPLSNFDPVKVTCNKGFAPAPTYDRFANCNGTQGLRPNFEVPGVSSYDANLNQYSIRCTYCNWESQVMSCKPLSCNWYPELEPNGKLLSTIADDLLRIGNGSKVAVQCNFGWRASANSSGFAKASDPNRFDMTCLPDPCESVRALDTPKSVSDLSCQPVTCNSDTLIVPGAQPVQETVVVHNQFVEFHCSPGFRSAFATSCSSNEPFYGLCTDGNLAFYANNDEDPVMRGAATMGAAGICVPKTCPRLDHRLHPNTEDMQAFTKAIFSPAGPGQDAFDLTVNCSEGYRVGSDLSLPDGADSYQLRCDDCIWTPCEDLPGYADNEGDTCAVWAENPTWCYGSPEDGVVDLPTLYANAEGIDPSIACCVCGGGGTIPAQTCQGGYCPHVHFDAENHSAIEGVLQGNTYRETISLDGSEGETPLMDLLKHGETVKVKCKPGYRIKGNNAEDFGVVTCTDTGLYPADMESICVPLLCDVFPGVENSVERSCNQPVETSVSTCQEACGSQPFDSDSENVRCKWYQCMAGCVPCFCSDESEFKTWLAENNRPGCPLLCGESNIRVEFGSDVNVTCESDYYLEGGSCSEPPEVSGKAQCDLQGKWASVPKCKKIPTRKICAFLDPNAKVSALNPVIGQIDPAAHGVIECKPGFVAVQNASQAVFSEDVTFQTNYTVDCDGCIAKTTDSAGLEGIRCMPISCAARTDWLEVDPNLDSWSPEDVPVSFGSALRLTCKEGYRAPASPHDSASKRLPNAPRSYIITCDLGEILNDGDSPTANFTSEPSAACEPVSCGRAPNLQNSINFGEGTYEFGDHVTYTCNAGYRIDGEGCSKNWTATCQDDGAFDLRSCVPVTCKADAERGLVTVQDISGKEIPYRSGVTYGCEFGYEIKPNTFGIRGTCQDDCTISPHLKCIKKECQVPADSLANVDGLNGATASVGAASFAETIPISCAEGYVIAGKYFDGMCISTFYATCLSNHRFTLVDELKCVKAQCPDPKDVFAGREQDLVENAVVTFSDNVTIQCKPGYVIWNSGTCLRDGTCDDSMDLKCGNGAADGEACQWQTPPMNKCFQKNICRNYIAWEGSTVTRRHV